MQAKSKTQKTATEKKAESQTRFKETVNSYGFIHLSKSLMNAWQLKKGEKQPISIELQDDALIVRKA